MTSSRAKLPTNDALLNLKISSSLNQTTLSFNQASLLARVWLLILTIASGVGAIQELLHLLPVLDARLQNQPPPVNRNQPSNDVNGCEHLDDPNHQLGFAPLVRVSQATANHGSGTWEDHVEDEADVGPNAAKAGQRAHQLPQFRIFLPVHRDCLFAVFEALLGKLRRSSLVVILLLAIVLLGLAESRCVKGGGLVNTTGSVLSHFCFSLA